MHRLTSISSVLLALLIMQLITREAGESGLRSFPAAAMEGIRSLTAEAASSAASDAFQHATAVAARTRLARCLFYLYDTITISLHSKGNAPLLRAVRSSAGESSNSSATHGALGPTPEAADGGDLLSLIELLRWSGDSLWVSIEHGDGNPLWEVCWTLLSALAAALFPRGDRYDPFSADRPHDRFHPLLVRGSQLVSFRSAAASDSGDPRVSVNARLWGAAGLLINAGAYSPASWRHNAIHAAVLLVMGLWHFAAFRAEPRELARDLREERDASDAATMHERGTAAAEAGGSDIAAALADIVRRWPGCSTSVGGSEESMGQLEVSIFGSECAFTALHHTHLSGDCSAT